MSDFFLSLLKFVSANVWLAEQPSGERTSYLRNKLLWFDDAFENKTDNDLLKVILNLKKGLDKLTDDDLSEQHSEVFFYTNADICLPLWESAYTEEKGVLLDETTLSVIRAYREEGLCAAVKGEPADSLGIETDFLIYLFRVRKLKEAQLFFKTHLIELYKGFSRRLLSIEKISEYFRTFGELIGILAEYPISEEIVEDRFLSSEEDNPLYMLHLKKLPVDCQNEPLKEELIQTAGRGNCGGRCKIKAFVTAGCVTHLESDVAVADDDFTVKACVRGRGYRRTYLSEDRLRYPMVRIGERGEGRFRRISWNEALELIEKKLSEITDKYGVGSRYIQYSSGVSTIVRGDVVMRRLLAKSGGFLDFYNSYSSACSGIAVPYTYGTIYTNSTYRTYMHTKFLILWGENSVVTLYNYRVFEYLRYLKEHNVPIIVIDPQFSDTAAVFATEWIPIRPGTDSALAAAMAYVILDNGLEDRHFMNTYCLGFDKEHMPKGCKNEESYEDYLFGIRDGVEKTPEWAEKITGIPSSTIKRLAISYAKSKPAAIVPGLGFQRHANGEQSVRSVSVLSPLTGNVGIAGGSTGARGFLLQHSVPQVTPYKNEYGAKIPSFLWTDAIVRGREMTRVTDHVRGREKLSSDIKLIFNLAGNTLINQHSDINRTIKLLKDTSLVQFIVVSDLWMTPSARFADLLLPGTSLFENDAMSPPWSEGDYLLYSNQVIEPLFESRFEAEWVAELGERMGLGSLTDGCKSLKEWLEKLYNENKNNFEPELPEFSEFTKNGGYKYKNNHVHIAFEDEISDLENHPFPTESGKIEVYSKALAEFGDYEHIPPIPKYVEEFEGVGDENMNKYPLQLIGWHTKRRTHSVHDNNPWMEAVEPHRVWINPSDAEERGIDEEMLVKVFNDRGAIELPAHISGRIMKGVVCVPQGAWYTPDSRGIDVRGSINVLSIQKPTPLAKGNPQHSNLVEIVSADR